MTVIDRAGDIDEFTRLKIEEGPRTIAEMKAEDSYQEGVVTEATLDADGTYWSLGWREDDGGSYGCGCSAKEGVEIKPGDRIRIYGKGFGSTFHGIDINDTEMFWRTPWERFAERVRWLADYDRRKRERFAASKEQMDRDYEALPEAFRARIDRFRSEQADFRVDSEAYEMAAVKDGALFAERARAAADANENAEEVEAFWAGDWRQHFSNPESVEPTDPAIRWLGWWWALNSKLYDYDYKRQAELMPGMNDGHSGNTFGGARALAWAYLEGKSL